MAQVVEHLPSKFNVLSSNSSTIKKEKRWQHISVILMLTYTVWLTLINIVALFKNHPTFSH
jgi:hypothetical protein